ncbi:MAG: aminotransferase class I/II-fold pyridoxal phosphate-dependent enzyme [Spirochaetaceae bacterium]|jgi:cystathionine beta-lyase/cystathionine gamma-synthase|nr:aminotransferase class I/II-fold pyridoxal phosphate-dependent enzyme [Spirochaetaceae bacterium]
MQFGTILIHNEHEFDAATGALVVPVYQSSTFAQRDISAGQEFDYSRSGNPTRKALESAIARLEGGAAGYAFGSGMGAIASVLGIFSAGDHIIAAEDIYGGSYRILNTFYKRWGLEHSACDASNIENIKKALRSNTKAIFLETPSNPLLKITDLRAACAFAREAGLLAIVDNTFMTPLLQRPIELGADIVVHSGTKFLGGHSDVVSGLAVARSEEIGRRIYAVQNGFGAIPGPWDVFLMLRGLKTLKVRLEAAQQTAAKLALHLNSHSAVEAVYYPGLNGHSGRELHESQASGAGAVLSFKTKTEEAALNFLRRVKLAAPAVSLGGVETIASYPVKMSHAGLPPHERERLGITPALIRISAGLEAPEDLIADFDAALA